MLNGGAIRRDRQYPAGTSLTERDILQELPFQDRVVVLRAERVIGERGATRLVSPVVAYIRTEGGIAAPRGHRLIRR